MIMTTTSLAKIALIVMSCTGNMQDQNCGDEFAAETWVADTYLKAKDECERFLRDEFDPNDYLYISAGDYAAVRCE